MSSPYESVSASAPWSWLRASVPGNLDNMSARLIGELLLFDTRDCLLVSVQAPKLQQICRSDYRRHPSPVNVHPLRRVRTSASVARSRLNSAGVSERGERHVERRHCPI